MFTDLRWFVVVDIGGVDILLFTDLRLLLLILVVVDRPSNYLLCVH